MNVSSIASKLDSYSEKIQERFKTTRSLQDLEDLITHYEVSKINTMSLAVL